MLANTTPSNVKIFYKVAGVGLLVRLLYLSWGLPDLWSDSYHNWYINWATFSNQWIYSDYKGRELVWLPFFRYIAQLLSLFLVANQI